MEFNFNKHDVRVDHLNLREEKHGEVSKQAVDVKIKASVPNDFLSYLHPTLKWSLYDKDDQPDLVPDEKHLPRLRYASMDPIKWRGEMIKAAVTFHGAKAKDDKEVVCTVGKLVLEPLDGGTVQVTFVCQFYPDPAEVGFLAGVLGRDIKFSVEPEKRDAD